MCQEVCLFRLIWCPSAGSLFCFKFVKTRSLSLLRDEGFHDKGGGLRHFIANCPRKSSESVCLSVMSVFFTVSQG